MILVFPFGEVAVTKSQILRNGYFEPVRILKKMLVLVVESLTVILKSGLSERLQVAFGIAAESVNITFLLCEQLSARIARTGIKSMLFIVFFIIEPPVFPSV